MIPLAGKTYKLKDIPNTTYEVLKTDVLLGRFNTIVALKKSEHSMYVSVVGLKQVDFEFAEMIRS